jgi:hypothetical protein
VDIIKGLLFCNNEENPFMFINLALLRSFGCGMGAMLLLILRCSAASVLKPKNRLDD